VNKVTLYGLNKNGSFKEWSIWTNGESLFIEHGQEGGKLQLKEEKVKGKNIGRSNETSDSEQAKLEATSRINKQVDKGYRADKEELTELPLLPMLANDYLKQGHRIKYPCWVSDKLDGVRCLAIRSEEGVVLKSRGGKLYDVKHIQDQLSLSMRIGEIWDGELYIHGKYLEEIVSAVKKPNDMTKDLWFVVFDVVNGQPFEKRLQDIVAIHGRTMSQQVDSIVYSLVDCEQEMKAAHKACVARGYEGIMLRNKVGLYESGKRSADLQKYKEFLDSEFKIVDIISDKDGGAIFVVDNTFADNQFNVVGGSHEQRKQWLSEKEYLIGKQITVKYQTTYKDTKIPQFPTFVSFRDYE
jgi:DNA ligase-1